MVPPEPAPKRQPAWSGTSVLGRLVIQASVRKLKSGTRYGVHWSIKGGDGRQEGWSWTGPADELLAEYARQVAQAKAGGWTAAAEQRLKLRPIPMPAAKK